MLKHCANQAPVPSLASATDDEHFINQIIQYYSDHPSIIEIREGLIFTQLSEDFKFKQVAESDINKLLKDIDDKKSTGIDKISPKLVKKPAAIICKRLYDAMCYNLLAGIFPDDEKVSRIVVLVKNQTIK